MYSNRLVSGLRTLAAICVVLLVAVAPAAAQDVEAQFAYAAGEGDIRTVTRILDGGFDVNTQWGMFEQFALLKAAEWGHAEMVRFLLSRGANPKLQDSSGRTALAWATNNGHAEVVRVLREAEGLPGLEPPRAAAPAPARAPAPAPAPARTPAQPQPRPAPAPPPAPPAAALPQPGAAPQDGRWRGTVSGITDGGTQYVEFRVRGGRIVESTFHLDYHCAPQYVYRERTTLGFDQPIAVQQGRFAANRKAPAVELEAAGRFPTATTAEGTFKMEDSNLCTTRLARWSARRVGA